MSDILAEGSAHNAHTHTHQAQTTDFVRLICPPSGVCGVVFFSVAIWVSMCVREFCTQIERVPHTRARGKWQNRCVRSEADGQVELKKIIDNSKCSRLFFGSLP